MYQAHNVPRDELNGLCADFGAIQRMPLKKVIAKKKNAKKEIVTMTAGVDKIFDRNASTPDHGTDQKSNVRDEYFPQACSHFSYEKSNQRLMVVDLQGVFLILLDGSRDYWLTDSVIHKKQGKRYGGAAKSSRLLRNWDFGRTDRGTEVNKV